MLKSLIRTAIRSRLLQHGSLTCSELVLSLGLDPRRHKGTIHAIMVDLEQEGIIAATRSRNGKRNRWFMIPGAARKRDLLAATIL